MVRSRTVKTFPLAEVSSIDRSSEVDPREVGLSQGSVEAIWSVVEDFYNTGIHPAISICVRRQGEIIINRAIGHTHGNGPDDPPDAEKRLARPDSLFNLFSASKAITAVVVHHMAEQGLVHIDDPLYLYLHEFEQGAKRHITIAHVLAHQSGVPKVPDNALDLDLLQDPEAYGDIFTKTLTQWKAGHSLAYHALSGGFIMSELVRRVSGMDIREYLSRYFLKPLKFEHFNYGVAPEEVGEVAPHVYTGIPFPRIVDAVYVKRLLGVSYAEAIELSNDPRFLTGIIPSANIIGTAEETSRFYELLLRGGSLDGVRVMQPETVEQATNMHVDGFDRMIGLPIKYSQGFMLGRKFLSMYGNDTPGVFGHIGFLNVVGFADRQRDISVGIMNNGKPGLSTGIVKFMTLLNTIASEIPKSAS